MSLSLYNGIKVTIPNNVTFVIGDKIIASTGSGSGSGGFPQYALTFTTLSFSSLDVRSPDRGWNTWNGVNPWNNITSVKIPTINDPSGNITSGSISDIRFQWNNFEDATSGSYDWTTFDLWVKNAIDHGQTFIFGGIMPVYANGTQTPYAGSYPTYLHTLMQSEAITDWYDSTNQLWVPNWNSQYYLGSLKNLLAAISNRINTQVYNGVSYSAVIHSVDIRGYGNYGEWHNTPYAQTMPRNITASSATLTNIINYHTAAFQNYPLTALIGATEIQADSYVPLDVTYYVLTASNNWGQIGIRVDHWGTYGITNDFENNTHNYNGLSFSASLLSRYKVAPLLGETDNSPDNITNNFTQPYFYDLKRQVQTYGISSLGDGNFYAFPGALNLTQSILDNMISSSNYMGYRMILAGGSAPLTASSSGSLPVTLYWQNIGTTPPYFDWVTSIELQNRSTNAVIWSATSSQRMKLFQPNTSSYTSVADSFTLPSISTGTYRLVVKIKDPYNYRKPMVLALSGSNSQRSDGSYTIVDSFNVI
jgi:hypothetical protein